MRRRRVVRKRRTRTLAGNSGGSFIVANQFYVANQSHVEVTSSEMEIPNDRSFQLEELYVEALAADTTAARFGSSIWQIRLCSGTLKGDDIYFSPIRFATSFVPTRLTIRPPVPQVFGYSTTTGWPIFKAYVPCMTSSVKGLGVVFNIRARFRLFQDVDDRSCPAKEPVIIYDGPGSSPN